MLTIILASVMSLSVFAAESFLTEAKQNGLRYDFTCQAGYEFVMNHSVTVNGLGRPDGSDYGGMMYEHTILLWDCETQKRVCIGVVGPESPIDDLGFRTVQLETPVTLYEGCHYIITSTEELSGDFWYDVGTGAVVSRKIRA